MLLRPLKPYLLHFYTTAYFREKFNGKIPFLHKVYSSVTRVTTEPSKSPSIIKALYLLVIYLIKKAGHELDLTRLRSGSEEVGEIEEVC